MRKAVLGGMAAFSCVVLAAWAAAAVAQEDNGSFPRHAREAAAAPVARIIIGLRPEGGTARVQAAGASRIQSLSERTGVHFRADHEINGSMRVVDLDTPVSGSDLADTLARLASDPAVAFAEPDGRAYRHAVANDNLFPNQWYLQNAQPSALDAVSAWDVTTGSAETVVAVLDTGVRFDHPDLLQAGRGGRLLPGRDFVGPDPGSGGFRLANDGDGWDPNPADPGDWITAGDTQSSLFSDCDVSGSSWHGTRVAGLIGAITNNGEGMAGVTWSTWVLPVRVLGKCFGNNSDILQGMRWAAGLPVAGVPDNPYPAKIINMSLGAAGSCTLGYLNVLGELASAGVLVVASAGNSGGPVEYPGNCPGVAAVTGLRHIGTKVGFSSLGPEVTVGAPGGNCVNLQPPCLFSLDTTVNLGSTVATTSSYTDQFDYNVGTSFSAPLVAAVAALMHGVNGNLTPPQLIARIREGAQPFPAPPSGIPICHVPVNDNDQQTSECGCTTLVCGAGMANARTGVAAALRPVAAVSVPASFSAGQDVNLNGLGSAAACGRTIASYAWTPVGGATTITGADTATATVVAPAGAPFVVRLTVTDDQGAVDTADVTVSSTTATTTAPATAGNNACPVAIVPADPGPFVDDGPPPAAPSGGGGGGGAWGFADMLILALGGALSRLRNRHLWERL